MIWLSVVLLALFVPTALLCAWNIWTRRSADKVFSRPLVWALLMALYLYGIGELVEHIVESTNA